MTAPLTPPDCDLRDFPSMMLDHRRLLTSETWIEAAQVPRLGHALMSLWCESFQQVPAASLPSSDVTLLRLSMCPTPAEWKKVKARALASWVACSDGRLYHPVVAEKALEAWLEKLASRLSSGAGNAKRWKIPFDPAPIEEQMRVARALLSALNPQSRSLAKRRTAGVPHHVDLDADGIPPGSQGKGREGKGSEEKEEDTHTAGEALPESWALPKPWGVWAIEQYPHWTPDVVRAIAARFADHHSAKGTRSLDWLATWRLWCSDELTQRAHPAPSAAAAPAGKAPPSNTVPSASADRTREALAEREVERQRIAALTPDQRAEVSRIARETSARLKASA